MIALPHRMRGPLPGDIPLLAKSWIQEMRHAPFSRGVPDESYFTGQRRLVLALLRRAWTLVACNPEDENHIYGFATFELGDPLFLHWFYVKSAYQRIGLGTALLATAFGEFFDVHPIRCTQVAKFALNHPAYLERHKLVPDPHVLMAVPPPAPIGATSEPVAEFEPLPSQD